MESNGLFGGAGSNPVSANSIEIIFFSFSILASDVMVARGDDDDDYVPVPGWPSGLRRCVQVVSQTEAWVRILPDANQDKIIFFQHLSDHSSYTNQLPTQGSFY